MLWLRNEITNWDISQWWRLPASHRPPLCMMWIQCHYEKVALRLFEIYCYLHRRLYYQLITQFYICCILCYMFRPCISPIFRELRDFSTCTACLVTYTRVSRRLYTLVRRPPHFWISHNDTLTLGRIPLDEWSATGIGWEKKVLKECNFYDLHVPVGGVASEAIQVVLLVCACWLSRISAGTATSIS